jgi:hypothetical protein
LEADSVRMKVRGEGGIEVGASIDGPFIVVVVLEDCDPLSDGELLF